MQILHDETRTLDQLLDHLERTKDKPAWSSISEDDGHTWAYGISHYEKAAEILTHGWNEGREKLIKTAETLNLTNVINTGVGYRTRLADEGEEVDVGKFLEQEDDYFWNFVAPEQNVINIHLMEAVSCNVDAAVIERKGLAVAALCQILESNGYSVNLVAVTSISNRSMDKRFRERIIVKRAEDPLDLSRIAFVLAHPAYNRKIMFRATEVSEHNSIFGADHVYGGYGCPTQDKELEKELKQDSSNVFIKASKSGDPVFSSDKATQQWIIEQAEKYGVMFEQQE